MNGHTTGLLLAGIIAVALPGSDLVVAGSPGGGEVIFSGGWDGPPGSAASPASQCDGTTAEKCDVFAICADDFESPAGAVITNVDVRGTFFSPAGEAGDIDGFIVAFFDGGAGAPVTNCSQEFVATIFECSGDPSVYNCDITLPDGGYMTTGGIEWVSITPIMAFPPQWAWISTDAMFGSTAWSQFDGGGGLPTCDSSNYSNLGTNLTFRLRGVTDSDRTTAMRISGGSGQSGCSVVVTPTIASTKDCGPSICPESFGNGCRATVGSADGLTPNLLANVLAVNLNEQINSGVCGPLLSVENIGPILLVSTSSGVRPRLCVNDDGVVGGPNNCEVDACNFTFAVGTTNVLPSIPSGADNLTTTKSCDLPTEEGGTWMQVSLPGETFDRDGLGNADPVDMVVRMSGVGRDLEADDSDTTVQRLDDANFGRCSGDFSREGANDGVLSPDGVVDLFDRLQFVFCQNAPPGTGDCSFFDYDGDNNITGHVNGLAIALSGDAVVFVCLEATDNSLQCCPGNVSLPQVASNVVATEITRLHLRGCQPIQITRDGQPCAENWIVDSYISAVPPQIRDTGVGECDDTLDAETGAANNNDSIETADNVGLLSGDTPRLIAGNIGNNADCDQDPFFTGDHDADVYRFTLAFFSRVQISVDTVNLSCAGGNGGLVSLYLYDAAGLLLGSDDPAGLGDPLISVSLGSGVYYALVAATSQVEPPHPAQNCAVSLAPGKGNDDPTGNYDLNLSVSPQSSMTITQVTDNGGTFDSSLLVQLLVSYQRVCDPYHAVLIDTGTLGLDAIILEATNSPWVRELDEATGVIAGAEGFVPGVADNGGEQTVAEIQHNNPSGGEYAHRVTPPKPRKCDSVESNCVFLQSPDGDQTNPGVGAAFVAGIQEFAIAESFTLDSATTIASVTWWATPAGTVDSSYRFFIKILADSSSGICGSSPGAVLWKGMVSSPIVKSTVADADFDSVTVNLEAVQELPAGTYWISFNWDADLPGAQPFFVTSLEGDGEYFQDILPEVGGDGCTGTITGDGFDCDNTPDDPGTPNCDEGDPDGDRVTDNGDIAFCVSDLAAEIPAMSLPSDVACGNWRSMEGSIIWTQPFAVRSDGFVGTFSDFNFAPVEGGRQAADSFTVGEFTTITDLHWRGGYGGATAVGNVNPNPDNFRIEFFNDANGLPSNLFVAPYLPGAVERTPGELSGDPGRQVYDYRYTLDPPLNVGANTTIWVSVIADTSGEDYNWFFTFSQGGNSDGLAASRDIFGGWETEGTDGIATDYSFDLTVEGTTKIISGDSGDCGGTASGLGYRFDSQLCYINGYTDSGDTAFNGMRWRSVNAPWMMYSDVALDIPGAIDSSKVQALLNDAGISAADLDCLTENIGEGKLVAGVFSGVAAYDSDAAANGLSVGGSLDRLCNGAVVEALDPTQVFSENLTVKGICWDNGTATFSVSGGTPPVDPPVIVHGEGEPGDSLFTAPCSGYIDPRRESTNGIDHNLGVDSVRILFNVDVFGDDMGGAVTSANFTIMSTGGTAPTAGSVTMLAGNYVELSLVGLPPLQEWTTIVADVYNSAGVQIDHSGGNMGEDVAEPDRVDFAALPADIDQNGRVQPLDLLRMRQRLVNSCTSACPDCGGRDEFYFDIDRNGNVLVLDLLRWRQLWFGSSGASMAWQGEQLNSDQP